VIGVAVRAVLFDLGNTLERCNLDEHEVFNRIFAQLGLPERKAGEIYAALEATRRDFQARGVHQTKENFDAFWVDWDSQVLARLGVAGDVVQHAREIHRRWFDCLTFHLYDDAMPALRAMKDAGLALAIVSNGTERELAHVMGRCGLDAGIFDAIVGADTFASDKPDRRIFEGALKRLGVSAAEAVFVGDKPETDGGAADVGMRFIWLDRRDAGGARERIRTLAELPGLLKLH
jgi:putative hydrolase of the HAD superfamily